MTPDPTNQERVLAALATSDSLLDDDALSRRTGIRRQTINQICNRLVTAGLIVRLPGPDGKLVNSLRAPKHELGVPTVEPQLTTALAAGNSGEQQAAEAVMLAVLGATLGCELVPRRIEHPSGARVQIDGADGDLRTLVECWAHQGTAKVAQKNKLMNDAIKLHWIAGSLSPSPERLILCVSDEAAIRHLRGKSWQGQAITELGVELHVVELPQGLVASIAEAQARQYR